MRNRNLWRRRGRFRPARSRGARPPWNLWTGERARQHTQFTGGLPHPIHGYQAQAAANRWRRAVVNRIGGRRYNRIFNQQATRTLPGENAWGLPITMSGELNVEALERATMSNEDTNAPLPIFNPRDLRARELGIAKFVGWSKQIYPK